jgi:disulfide bond formation protein DsbB
MPASLSLRAALFLIAVGAISLGTAFGSQYLGGLNPCPLCTYQRYPYGVVIALGVLLALLHRQRGVAVVLVALAAIALFVDAGIAAFHVGVEEHWWEGLKACEGTIDPTNMTVEELAEALKQAPPVPCDQKAFVLFGISMAGYNFLYASISGLIATVLAFRLFRSPR